MNASNPQKPFTEEIKGTASEIIKQIKKLIKEGSARRIIIKNKEGKTLFQSQLTVGVGGTAFVTAIAPVVSAISMFVLFMNDVQVIVERYPEEESKDEYEVEAEIIEIRDEEEDESDNKDDHSSENNTDKTVGKDEET